MGRGSTDLSSSDYDNWLSKNKRERELRQRHLDRRNANKGYAGWHFGIDDKPVHTTDKESFRRELDKRGLVMRDDVKRDLR